jgi:hypothetical protein
MDVFYEVGKSDIQPVVFLMGKINFFHTTAVFLLGYY